MWSQSFLKRDLSILQIGSNECGWFKLYSNCVISRGGNTLGKSACNYFIWLDLLDGSERNEAKKCIYMWCCCQYLKHMLMLIEIRVRQSWSDHSQTGRLLQLQVLDWDGDDNYLNSAAPSLSLSESKAPLQIYSQALQHTQTPLWWQLQYQVMYCLRNITYFLDYFTFLIHVELSTLNSLDFLAILIIFDRRSIQIICRNQRREDANLGDWLPTILKLRKKTINKTTAIQRQILEQQQKDNNAHWAKSRGHTCAINGNVLQTFYWSECP